MRKRFFRALALGAASGLLLLCSDFPLHLWWLQVVALVPLLWALTMCERRWEAALVAVCLGACQLVPLSIFLQFPVLMAVALALYLTMIWVLVAIGCYQALKWWRGPWAALACGAVAAVVEWVDFSLVPVWGTAQCFARVWSAAPPVVQLLDVAGVTGLVFVLVSTQALAVLLLKSPPGASRRRAAVVLAAIVGLVAVYDVARWSSTKAGQHLRVAAIGWTHDDLQRLGVRGDPLAILERAYLPRLREAVARGARLVVSPEAAFWVSSEQKQELFGRLAQQARQSGALLAVGYFDRSAQQNRVAFVGQEGKLRAEYTKTHLIWGIENYRAGRGELAVIERWGGKVGAMICQDDNFTDLSRAYGRRGVMLVVVPTNDWRQVRNYHLENAIFRTVESRYAVVRAASNGISAVISARGETLAAADHFATGAKVIVADLPLHSATSLYSWAGEWLALASALLLAVGVWLRRRS